MKLQVFHSFSEESQANRIENHRMTPEQRLDLVEKLRVIAGKLYFNGYPTRLRRIFVPVTKDQVENSD